MSDQRGNALFLILIAVALFAALSYAITSSGRGGGDVSKERAAILSAQISQTLSSMSTGITRMNARGYSNDEIVFHGGTKCVSDWITCDSGEDCLFAPEGGDVLLTPFPREAFAGPDVGMAYPGDPSSAGTTNFWLECDADLYDWTIGTTAGDRGFFLLNVAENVCAAFNKGVGINGIPGQGGVPSIEAYGVPQSCEYKSGSDKYQLNYLLQAF